MYGSYAPLRAALYQPIAAAGTYIIAVKYVTEKILNGNLILATVVQTIKEILYDNNL